MTHSQLSKAYTKGLTKIANLLNNMVIIGFKDCLSIFTKPKTIANCNECCNLRGPLLAPRTLIGPMLLSFL